MPAFGSPTSAASATSFSRSSSSASSPGRPVSAKRGVWRVAVAKRAFPRPATPPFASTSRRPGAARSTSSSSSPALQTCVPTGTARTTSSPLAPWRRLPPPFPPRPPRNVAFVRNTERSRRSGSATITTSPPRPPSPPSGPPLGTNFSRRKLSAPSPPRPATTLMLARSWNTGASCPSRFGHGWCQALRDRSRITPVTVSERSGGRDRRVPRPGAQRIPPVTTCTCR